MAVPFVTLAAMVCVSFTPGPFLAAVVPSGVLR